MMGFTLGNLVPPCSQFFPPPLVSCFHVNFLFFNGAVCLQMGALSTPSSAHPNSFPLPWGLHKYASGGGPGGGGFFFPPLGPHLNSPGFPCYFPFFLLRFPFYPVPPPPPPREPGLFFFFTPSFFFFLRGSQPLYFMPTTFPPWFCAISFFQHTGGNDLFCPLFPHCYPFFFFSFFLPGPLDREAASSCLPTVTPRFSALLSFFQDPFVPYSHGVPSFSLTNGPVPPTFSTPSQPFFIL